MKQQLQYSAEQKQKSETLVKIMKAKEEKIKQSKMQHDQLLQVDQKMKILSTWIDQQSSNRNPPWWYIPWMQQQTYPVTS